MIQRSKLGLKFFSPAFSTPCLSSGPVNRSDAWHITVTLPAQKGCAQTISANVLKASLEHFIPQFIVMLLEDNIKRFRHNNVYRGFARQPYWMAEQWKLFALERHLFPWEKESIVPAIQHGCRAKPLFWDRLNKITTEWSLPVFFPSHSALVNQRVKWRH